ncbi:MAG: SCO family protein [Magnetococcales bacterium]|nr:SCO family protein [Magnetococcales bacterium]
MVSPVPLKGDFSLLDEDGQRVSLATYRGRAVLAYFGYTFCPDVCPTNLGAMSSALALLPEAVAGRIQPLFVTVDPERDTVAQLRDYTASFHDRLVGLTGTAAEVAQAARAFGVYYARVEEQGNPDGYLMDHGSSTYLVDGQGRLISIFPHNTDPKVMADAIIELLKTR